MSGAEPERASLAGVRRLTALLLVGLMSCVTTRTAPAPYAPHAVKLFMSKCAESKLTPSYCACILERLNRMFDEQDMLHRLKHQVASKATDKLFIECKSAE